MLALCLASSERLYLVREELCTPSLYYPNSQWRFPVWESSVDDIVEILLCEGRDVEQWLEPRNKSRYLRLINDWLLILHI